MEPYGDKGKLRKVRLNLDVNGCMAMGGKNSHDTQVGWY